MRRISLLMAGLLLPMGVGAGTLNIDSVIIDGRNGATLTTTCRNTAGYYLERGTPGSEAGFHAVGAVKGTPLVSALNTLVPAGWRVTYAESLNRERRVDWSGGLRWPQVLERLAKANNLVLLVDWDRHEVYVDQL